jgi:prepilin-type N-terminal cleavage/methylation domain-containing protein/prepilin-type processing-associated H-X9-DG protein
MRSYKTRAFSLVELLVVISIIALLISLIMPAISKSREVALQTRCTGNLRQFGTPLAMYSDANKDWMPTSGYSHVPATAPNAPNWAGISADIMGIKYITEYTANNLAFNQQINQSTLTRKNGIFQCPSDRYLGTWGASLASTSYGWNDSPYGLGRNDVFNYTPSQQHARTRRSQIKIPSDTIMLGDRITGITNPVTGWGTFTEYQHSQFDTTTNARAVTLHNEFVNILWADGRASTRDKYTLLPADFDRRD